MMGIPGLFRRPVRIGLALGAQTLKAAWAIRRAGGRVEWHFVQSRRTSDTAANGLRQDLTQLLHPVRRLRCTASLALCAPTSYVRLLTVRTPELKRLAGAGRGGVPALLARGGVRG